jgi:hypothetical protein
VTTPAAGGAFEAATGAVTGSEGVQPQGGQGAPAAGQQQDQGGAPQGGLYDKYLANIPKQLHGTVTEAFKTWDSDVTKRQQGLQTQLSAFQPLIDSGADPTQLQAAHEFLAWMQEDPKAALAMAAQTFEVDLGQLGATPGDGQEGQQQQVQGQPAGPGSQQGGDIPPWFQQFQEDYGQDKQLLQLLAQAQVSQHEQQEMDQQVSEIEDELRSQTQAAGVDVADPQVQNFLLQALAATDDNVAPQQAVATAVKQWQDLTAAIRGQAANAGAPSVLPGGGGLPTQQVDPATLSPGDRRKALAARAAQLMQGG